MSNDKKETATKVVSCPICNAPSDEINKFSDWSEQCSRCLTPLKMSRKDGQPIYQVNQDMVGIDGFITITPPNVKPVIRRTVDAAKTAENYHVIYEGMYHSGVLRCPACHNYLCDFTGISGDLTQMCRQGLTEEKHGRKGICKTVTKFIFKNRPVGRGGATFRKV